MAALAQRIDERGKATERATAELAEYHRRLDPIRLCGVPPPRPPPRAPAGPHIRSSRASTLSLTVIFAYYILLSVGQALAEQERVPPALWLPNVVLGIVAVILFRRALREQPVLPELPIHRVRPPSRISRRLEHSAP